MSTRRIYCPQVETNKICIGCRLELPLNMFDPWGSNGRRRKRCCYCDPRFSLADSKEDATP